MNNLDVSNDRSSLSELEVTVTAGKGFLFSMNDKVSYKIMFRNKAFVAANTLVYFSNAMFQCNMFPTPSGCFKLFTTILTCTLLTTKVNNFMNTQGQLQSELLATY
jgi:hypothetical protein